MAQLLNNNNYTEHVTCKSSLCSMACHIRAVKQTLSSICLWGGGCLLKTRVTHVNVAFLYIIITSYSAEVACQLLLRQPNYREFVWKTRLTAKTIPLAVG